MCTRQGSSGLASPHLDVTGISRAEPLASLNRRISNAAMRRIRGQERSPNRDAANLPLEGRSKVDGPPKSDFSDLGGHDCQTRQQPSLVAHQLSGGGQRRLRRSDRPGFAPSPNRRRFAPPVLTRPPAAGSTRPGPCLAVTREHVARCLRVDEWSTGRRRGRCAPAETCPPVSTPNDIML